MKKLNKGFTLIELLVVIAIIGILSSVVLASLNTARAKGADAAIKSNINGMRAQAELVYDSSGTGSYEGVCENAQVDAAIDAVSSAGGTGVECADDVDGWAFISALKSDDAIYYCVDYTGAATSTAVNDVAVDTDLTCAND